MQIVSRLAAYFASMLCNVGLTELHVYEIHKLIKSVPQII